MNNVKLNSGDYSRIEEIQKFVNSFNNLVFDYNKSTKNKEQDLRNLNNQIDKKNRAIDNANKVTLDLSKKLEELEGISVSTKKRIKDLEQEKNSISFSNSDIQKMELQEISELIASKNAKVEKITNLINGTKSSISNNNKELNTLKNELTGLENAKVSAEKSLKRTDALIDLINETSKNYIDSVRFILSKDFLNKIEEPVKVADEEPKEDEKKEEPKEPIKKPVEEKHKEKPIDIDKEEKKEKPDLEKPKPLPVDDKKEEDIKIPIEPVIPEVSEAPIEKVDEPKPKNDENDFSILDNWEKELQSLNDDEKENTIKDDKEPLSHDKDDEDEDEDDELSNTGIINEIMNAKDDDFEEKEDKKEKEPEAPKQDDSSSYEEIKELFNKESINFNDFDANTQKELNNNFELVKKNLEILKRHNIPLSLTIKQPRIYYGIKDNDLDDLLSIITTDEGGNGMGFDISYTFYCLDELSKIDVDKLIDVYNKEFMNITSKSGIINLLKKTNPDLGEFRATIEANKKILKDYGINDPDEVEKECKSFVEIDNPLFLDLLNVFDKDDLVQKINSDSKIAEQILEYWKNN